MNQYVRALSICLGICLLGVALPAQEAATTPPSVESVVMPGADTSALKGATAAMVMFSGRDPLRTRILEDAVALSLARAGVASVSRTHVDRVVGEKTRIPPEGTGAADTAAMTELTPVSVTEVARDSGAGILLLGTVLEERLRAGAWTPGGRQGSLADLVDQPLVVTVVSVQVIDVATDKAVMVILGSYPGGRTLTETASDLVKPIMDARK